MGKRTRRARLLDAPTRWRDERAAIRSGGFRGESERAFEQGKEVKAMKTSRVAVTQVGH